MKLTKEKLRQIIKEELDMFDEPEPPENLEANDLQDRLWSEIKETIVSWLANSYQKQGMKGAFETANRDAEDLYRALHTDNIERVINDWAMAYVRSDDNTLEEG